MFIKILKEKAQLALATAIPNFKRGLVNLNISRCNFTTKALVALAKALESNDKICSTLECLNLSFNKLESEASKALSGVLAKAINLKELNLSHCNPEFHLLKKSDSLLNLDVSGSRIITKDSRHLELTRFLQLSPQLNRLNLSKTGVTADFFQDLIPSVPGLQYLDVSDNNFGDQGIISICEQLKGNKSIKSLNLDRNFDKPSKMRQKAVLSLSQLVASDTAIDALYIRGGPKAQLK